MKEKLTKRQQQILDYLRKSHQETGVMPSTREIQQYFGFASQTAAMGHLRSLEKKGVIQRLPGKARAVILSEVLEREAIVDIPIYGNIAAGVAEDQEQFREGCLSLDVRTLGCKSSEQIFALKVRGESMIDAHICDGDTVVLEFKDPVHGDVVAALVDGETTLKRYIHNVKEEPYLQAENELFSDIIPARELVIQGVMIALLRNAA